MGSQFDTVLLEMDIEDAERVVKALRAEAYEYPPENGTAQQYRVIASYIELQIATAKRLAESRVKRNVERAKERT